MRRCYSGTEGLVIPKTSGAGVLGRSVVTASCWGTSLFVGGGVRFGSSALLGPIIAGFIQLYLKSTYKGGQGMSPTSIVYSSVDLMTILCLFSLIGERNFYLV